MGRKSLMGWTPLPPMGGNRIQFRGRDVLLSELEEARQLALKHRQPSAAVQATMGKAKILGLIIDRREVGEAGAFDNIRRAARGGGKPAGSRARHRSPEAELKFGILLPNTRASSAAHR
jgi:hypothetical protein